MARVVAVGTVNERARHVMPSDRITLIQPRFAWLVTVEPPQLAIAAP
jgi:hypothetical protein